MITKNLTLPLFFFFFIFSGLSTLGQSIYGNVNAAFTNKNLAFANVNVYNSAGELVANVLTDAYGNFNVKLDTGLYKCEINYAGHEKVIKEIEVRADEKADFEVEEDEESEFFGYTTASEAPEVFGIREKEATFNHLTTFLWGEPKGKEDKEYGKLTAGEINDFSKWGLWAEIVESDLKPYRGDWDFQPTDRYTLQLQDKKGLPLANAKVELMNGKDVLFTSRSDNTGKAELWGSLKYFEKNEVETSSIRVTYNGAKEYVYNPKINTSGLNTLTLDVACAQSQDVDIAIVVDATGSMQDEIDYLKLDLNSVIYQAKEFSTSLNLRFANVFYRDTRDAYLTESQDFTHVLSESIAYTNKHNADGGGDAAEAVEVALDKAINNLSWNENTRTKILFLVLDAPPHNTPENREAMKKLSAQAAEKGIRIVPITGSGTTKSTEYLMRCLALVTNGTYVFLTDHSGIGDTHLKPTTDKYSVEFLNDILVRVIKSYTYMPDCEQQIADLGVNLPDSQVVSQTPSNVEDATAELNWKFYPNPTEGPVNIVSNMAIKELYITDLSGKALEVIRDIQPDQPVTADLSQYASGIYLIRYPVGKQWISGKIVLSRNSSSPPWTVQNR